MKVIQCWDDGLVSDIRLADILRRHQAKAAFCLNPGLYQKERSFGWVHENTEVWRLSINELHDVYDGFEICSHSMTHPYLTDLSPDKLNWEIMSSRDRLEDIFQKPVLGFCYPFNTYNESIIRAVRSAGYFWARGNQHQDHVYPPSDPLEFHPSCHIFNCDFWTKYDGVKKNNGVFFFWGHSYELINQSAWDYYEGTIDRISSDPEAEWSFVHDLFA
jgi:peptidoglycan/xylan/chitin deacetylase (PgdA/CDA1 family)